MSLSMYSWVAGLGTGPSVSRNTGRSWDNAQMHTTFLSSSRAQSVTGSTHFLLRLVVNFNVRLHQCISACFLTSIFILHVLYFLVSPNISSSNDHNTARCIRHHFIIWILFLGLFSFVYPNFSIFKNILWITCVSIKSLSCS